MRSHGNTIVNQIYNPNNVKPPVPTDIDETDSTMERYIRAKYQHRTLHEEKPSRPSRRETVRARSPSFGAQSPEGSPPPLPPKAGRFFGFGGLRSSLSSNNLRRPSTTGGNGPFLSMPRRLTGSPPPPIPDMNGSLGASVNVNEQKDPAFEAKMDALRQLGFQNERRNAIVLRELDGNFDKSIETLRRVGEGGGKSGIQANPTGRATTSSQQSSSNPFDMLDQKAPAAAQSNGKSYNPFDVPTAPAQSLESSFQGLQVSQPLFPHSTGGYPSGQVSAQSFKQQPLTPPIPGSLYQQQNNPFFQVQPSVAGNAFSNGSQSPVNSNPFFNNIYPQNTTIQQTQFQSQPGQFTDIPASQRLQHANTVPSFSSPPSPFAQASLFQQQQTPNPHNPFQSMTLQNGGYQPPFQQQSQLAPPQPLAPQQTGRMDKGSILSLYNLSPRPPTIAEQQPPLQQRNIISPTPNNPFGGSIQGGGNNNTTTNIFGGPTRSATYPSISPNDHSKNPFMTAPQSSLPAPQPQPQQQQQQPQPTYQNNSIMGMGFAQRPVNGGFSKPHMSQPSVDVSAFQGGRHSPDAFASLSSRYA